MGKSRGMNERIRKLREISVNTPVHIDLERAKIETDFYKLNDGKYSIPVMRAMTLKEYFSKKTLYLGDGELIVGEKGKDPQASPTFPELCCHSEEDMVVMSERKLVSFKTTEEDRRLQKEENHSLLEGKKHEGKTAFQNDAPVGMTATRRECLPSLWSREDPVTHAGANRYLPPIYGVQRKDQKDNG